MVFWGQVHTRTVGYGNDMSKNLSAGGALSFPVCSGVGGGGRGAEVERRHVYKGRNSEPQSSGSLLRDEVQEPWLRSPQETPLP